MTVLVNDDTAVMGMSASDHMNESCVKIKNDTAQGDVNNGPLQKSDM